MKQLYFTSCRTGLSVSGENGFRVRAESPGIPTDVSSAVTDAGRYRRPNGMPDGAVDVLPRQLVVVNLPNGQRAAIHSVAALPNPETNREGNFFLHAVVGTPEEVDPLTVVRAWSGPFWKTKDDNGPTNLPETPAVQALAPGPSFTPSTLKTIVGKKENRAAIEFLLTGILTGGPKQQLFLAAPAARVAECVFAALSALPPTVRSSITFSTYEFDPLIASARIAATWWAVPEGQDLDAMCYEGSGIGFNIATGRSSNLPPAPEYVRVAIEALLAGNNQSAFFAEATANQITDGQGLALLYRLLHGNTPLTHADLRLPQALTLADRIVARPEVVGLLAEAVKDNAFLGAEFPKYVVALKKNEPVRRKLAKQLGDSAVRAARDGHLEDAMTSWQNTLRALDPAYDYRSSLLKEAKFSEFPKEVGLTLLPKVLEVVNVDKKADVDAWLTPDPNDLAEVLKVVKNPIHRRAAARQCLSSLQGPDRLPASAIAALAADPRFAVDLTSEFPDSGGPILELLIAREPKQRWSEAIFACWTAGGSNPSASVLRFYDRSLASALEHEPAIDGRRVVAELSRFSGTKSPASLPLPTTLPLLARKLLDDHPSEWQTNAVLTSFLEAVASSPHGSKLNEDYRSTILARGSLQDFIKTPRLQPPQGLINAAKSLEKYPDDDERSGLKRVAAFLAPRLIGGKQSGRRTAIEEVLEAILRELETGKSGSSETYPWLCNVLYHLGPVYGSVDELLTELFDRASRSGLHNKEALLFAFMYFGFSPDPAVAKNMRMTPRQARRWGEKMREYYRRGKKSGTLSQRVQSYLEMKYDILKNIDMPKNRDRGSRGSGSSWYNTLIGYFATIGQYLFWTLVCLIVFVVVIVLTEGSPVDLFRSIKAQIERRIGSASP